MGGMKISLDLIFLKVPFSPTNCYKNIAMSEEEPIVFKLGPEVHRCVRKLMKSRGSYCFNEEYEFIM